MGNLALSICRWGPPIAEHGGGGASSIAKHGEALPIAKHNEAQRISGHSETTPTAAEHSGVSHLPNLEVTPINEYVDALSIAEDGEVSLPPTEEACTLPEQFFIELPELVILNIANFLSVAELRSFSTTCKRVYNIVPKLTVFNISQSEEVHIRDKPGDGHFGCVDTPTLPGHVWKLDASIFWKDQGWGYPKAFIFIHLIRDGVDIVTTDHNSGLFNGPAPNDFQKATCVLVDDEKVNKANGLNCNGLLRLSQAGDCFRFLLNCGGTGGHEVTVRDLKCSVTVQEANAS